MPPSKSKAVTAAATRSADGVIPKNYQHLGLERLKIPIDGDFTVFGMVVTLQQIFVIIILE